MTDNNTELVIAEGPANLLAAIITVAKDPALNVEKLAALGAMQASQEARQSIADFHQAFFAMEPNLPRVKKNGVVEYPVDKNKPDGPKRRAFNFARWEDVDAAIRPILRQYGFSLSFNTVQRAGDGGGVVVTGKLLHSGREGRVGHCETASFALPLDTSGGKSNLQGYASSTSFGQRYCTKMLLNLVFEGEDDDGVAGGMSYLSDAQVTELRDLMQQTATSEAMFLRYMGYAPEAGGLNSIGEIEARDFPKLKNALLTKRKVK